MARLYRFWSFADARRYNSAPMLLASILALIGFMGMMATDNPIVYGFFTAPLAVLLGTALGTFSRERRDDTATTA